MVRILWLNIWLEYHTSSPSHSLSCSLDLEMVQIYMLVSSGRACRPGSMSLGLFLLTVECKIGVS